MTTNWQIPEPLPVAWPMRTLSSAAITERTLDDGRLELHITHARLDGVTPKMMRWFISNLDRTIEWEGREVLAYRLWHPRDHIHHHITGRAADGSVGAGARFQIVEAFAAQRRFLVEQHFEVQRLDETGFVLVGKMFGQRLELTESFAEVPGGTQMTVQMRLGNPGGLLTPMAMRIARRLEREKLDAWKLHNVEEDGMLQHFVPALFARYG